MSACGETHESGATCDMPDGQAHAWHTGIVPGSLPPQAVDWPNAEDRSAALAPRSKAAREQHKASLRAAITTGDALADARARWEADKAEWIAEARRVLHRYCTEHAEPFTTPEHIWPLLDSPGEMRAFTVVVQHALRRRWIAEEGFVRLRGVYTTRDGQTFEMNKAVPVYRSRIVRLDLD